MNRHIIDPSILAQDLPDSLDTSFSMNHSLLSHPFRDLDLDPIHYILTTPDIPLGSGHSSCIKFNHRGDLLASGRLDGVVVIFDFETYGVAKKLRGHVRQVQSLSWASDDRYILSASLDWKAILWDLQTGEKVKIVRFQAPIFVAELHPKNIDQFVVALFEDKPILVDISKDEPVKRVIPTQSKQAQDNGEEEDPKIQTTIAKFTPSGNHIFTGTNKGWINVIDTKTCQTLASTETTARSIITLLKFTESGTTMVLNFSDRVIREFDVPNIIKPDYNFNEFSISQRNTYQDVVNRAAWNNVGLSNDMGEYVLGSTYMNHQIHIWERVKGSLMKILETIEEVSTVEWHPHKACVATIGLDEGRIYVYSYQTPQKWSALAPDFVEVEENIDYVEQEDEFDIPPPEELNQRRLDLEDEDVDVLTMDETSGYQFKPGDFCMPVLLNAAGSDSEDEIVQLGAGTFRKKSPSKEWMDGDTEMNASGDETKRSTNGRGAQNGPKRKRKE